MLCISLHFITNNVVHNCIMCRANDIYLKNLNKFLMKRRCVIWQKDDTRKVADMVQSFQNDYDLYFLSGGGSNQHNQLLLNRPNIDSLIKVDDVYVRKEIVLPTPVRIQSNPYLVSSSAEVNDGPKAIYAGGGHTGLLSKSGRLYLWGWNKDFQCGIRVNRNCDHTRDQPLPFIEHLENISVEKAALGFSHTLVVEKETGKVFAFGNDERGQVTGRTNVRICEIATPPMTPTFLKNEKVDIIDAGLFHSAVITDGGELITFGCNRFGQCNSSNVENFFSDLLDQSACIYRRWKPKESDRVIDVACGRRHTIAVDSQNRLWTWGENKYGQLGRVTKWKKDPTPSVVDMKGEIRKDDTVSVFCGWSHTVIHVVGPKGNRVFGFGRNDKGENSDLFENRIYEVVVLLPA